MKTDRELLELVRACLAYEKETGVFTWKKSLSNAAPQGSVAGKRKNNHGYCHIQINGKLYAAHRIAWLYVHGCWPDNIDHINGDRADNRFANLRSVSVQLNNHNQRKPHKNNSTGALGVVLKPSGKFAAEIRVCGKKKYLGSYETVAEASAAYKAAKAQLHQGAVL